MMQALLADRFKLAIHYETKQLPVYALVLDKPGKLGPHLQPHPEDSPCSTAPRLPDWLRRASCRRLPAVSRRLAARSAHGRSSTPGRLRVGGRNMPMAMLRLMFGITDIVGVDRPVLDKTGLTGKFDFVMEFTPQLNGPLPPGVDLPARPNRDHISGSFEGAVRAQAGIANRPGGSDRRRSCGAASEN